MKKLHKKVLLTILLILLVAGMFFAGSVYVIAYSSCQTPKEALNKILFELSFSHDCPTCLSPAD